MNRLIQASVLLAFSLQANLSFSSDDHPKKIQILLEDVKENLKRNARSSALKHQSELRYRNEDRLKSVNTLLKNKYSEDYSDMLGVAISSGTYEIAEYLIAETNATLTLAMLKDVIRHDALFEREDALWPLIQPQIGTLLTKKNQEFVRKNMILFLSNLTFQIQPELYAAIIREFDLSFSDLSLSLDKSGNTPLMLALCQNNSIAIDSLLEEADSEVLDKFNKFGWQAIHCAAMFASKENILKVLEKVADRKRRAYSYTFNRKVLPSKLLERNDRLSYDEKRELAVIMDQS